MLWDSDPRLPAPLIRALAAERDLGPDAVGDNEPYDGGLPGDTINAIATARGLANALIEVRQDLIGDARRRGSLGRPAGANRRAARCARGDPDAAGLGQPRRGPPAPPAAGLTRRARTAMAGPQNVSQIASNGTWNGQGSQSRRLF